MTGFNTINSHVNKLSIYQYMVIFLVVLNFTGAFFYGFGINALFPVFIAAITASVLDIIINHFKTRKFEIPYSGIISGLFIGGLLAQDLKWHVYLAAGIIAILSKHLIRVQQRHIFNPANFGVLLVSVIFGASHTWWLASPSIMMVLFGLFIIWKLRRFDLSFSFLASYLILSILFDFNALNNLDAIYLLIANSGIIAFFSMFMLIEPKTHPFQKKQRIIYGILVAVLLMTFN
ncbi:RnfABCDGE type electron transport complex subunit D, partial [Candidatus Woesearchaeota archaeon]|nr:RnfABCDGE type electron transport complex subunit D [Candidatus Woesearchaeota archaeon]